MMYLVVCVVCCAHGLWLSWMLSRPGLLWERRVTAE